MSTDLQALEPLLADITPNCHALGEPPDPASLAKRPQIALAELDKRQSGRQSSTDRP